MDNIITGDVTDNSDWPQVGGGGASKSKQKNQDKAKAI